MRKRLVIPVDLGGNNKSFGNYNILKNLIRNPALMLKVCLRTILLNI